MQQVQSLRRQLEDDEKTDNKNEGSPFKRSFFSKSTFPYKIVENKKKNSGVFKGFKEMPSLKKRFSFSPLKEREKRFIESSKTGVFTPKQMVGSIVTLNSATSLKEPWEFPKDRARSFLGISHEKVNIIKKKATTPRNFDYFPGSGGNHSPGKLSIFGAKELKKTDSEINEKSQKNEEFEIKSYHGDFEDSDEESVSFGDVKSHHSDSKVKNSNKYIDEETKRLLIFINFH